MNEEEQLQRLQLDRLPGQLRYWADWVEKGQGRVRDMSVHCPEQLRTAAIYIEELKRERDEWMEAALNPIRLKVSE